MTDIVYIGIAAVFFLLTWVLVLACERLGEQRPGEKS